VAMLNLERQKSGTKPARAGFLFGRKNFLENLNSCLIRLSFFAMK